VSSRTPAQHLGDAAEAVVAARLEALGWRVIARNLRLGRDEVDLVALDPGPPVELVIVEVRWRGRRDFGLPEETVDWRKRRRLRRAVGSLVTRLPQLAPDVGAHAVRVDLVAVEPSPRGPDIVRHHRGITL
jgi:putative endonuclease